MKKLLLFLFLFLTALSCGRNESDALSPLLVYADSMVLKEPTRVLRLLDSIGMPTSKREQAYWCLAYTAANIKLKQPQGDTLIRKAYDYFMRHGTLREQWRVLGRCGLIYFDLNQRDSAQQYQLRALETARIMGDTVCMIQSSHYLGTNYIYFDELLPRAAEAYKECLDLCLASRDTSWMGVTHLCMGRLYLTGNKQSPFYARWREGADYYREGIRFSTSVGADWEVSAGLGELAHLYLEHGELGEGLKCLQQAQPIHMRIYPNFSGPLYLGLVEAYTKVNQPDSVLKYTRLLQADSTFTGQNSLYFNLYNYAVKQRRTDDIIAYSDSMLTYLEKKNTETTSQRIIEAEGKYNQQKLLNEKNELRIQKDRTLLIALIVLVVLLIGVAALIYIYQRLLSCRSDELRRKSLRLYENESEIRRNEEQIQALLAQVEDNSQREEQRNEEQTQHEEQQRFLQQLQQMNITLRGENATLQTDIGRVSIALQKKQEGIDRLIGHLSDENRRLQQRERFLCEQVVQKSDVLHTLKSAPRYLDDIGWTNVRHTVDVLFDDFTRRLEVQIPSLTEGEWQIACLLKLGIPVADMAVVLGISPASVSQRKQRLKARVLQALDGVSPVGWTLDIWVMNF